MEDTLSGVVDFADGTLRGEGDSEENDESSSEAADPPKSFTLNGKTWAFENQVSLVLAAARQLGMVITRDARLLWIADEALLDEYDEEDAAAIKTIPERPLSDDVAEHYGDLFSQRSKDVGQLLLSPAGSDAGSTEGDRDSAPVPPEAGAPAVATIGSPGLVKTRKERRRELRELKRRRSLALREARLSGITERYTQEVEPLTDLEAHCGSSEQSPPSPLSPGAAVWPDDVRPPSAGLARSGGLGSLPRIESATMSLDQMAAACEAAESQPDGAAVPAAVPAVSSSGAVGVAGGSDDGADADAAARLAKDGESPAFMCEMRPADGGSDGEGRAFVVGDRVEVDYDDEGWFKGVVVEVRVSRKEDLAYRVRLDDGEYADSVEGSEIRTERRDEPPGEGESVSSGDRGCNTRSDALSGFELRSDVAPSERTSDGLPDEVAQEALEMRARVTASGAIDWSFIQEDQLTWAHPTLASVRAHDEKFPRWSDVTLKVDVALSKPVQ